MKIEDTTESLERLNGLLESALGKSDMNEQFAARDIDITFLLSLLVPLLGEEGAVLFCIGMHFYMLVSEAND
jgi:hypothetical protein